MSFVRTHTHEGHPTPHPQAAGLAENTGVHVHKTKVYAVRDGPFFLTPYSKQSLTPFLSSFGTPATQTSLWFLTDSEPSALHSLLPSCTWQAPLSPSGLISAAQGGLPRPLLQMVTRSYSPFLCIGTQYIYAECEDEQMILVESILTKGFQTL